MTTKSTDIPCRPRRRAHIAATPAGTAPILEPIPEPIPVVIEPAVIEPAVIEPAVSEPTVTTSVLATEAAPEVDGEEENFVDTPTGVRIFFERSMGDVIDENWTLQGQRIPHSILCSDGVARFTNNVLKAMMESSFKKFSDLEHTSVSIDRYWTVAIFDNQVQFLKRLLEARNRSYRPAKENAKSWLLQRIEAKADEAYDKAKARLAWNEANQSSIHSKLGITKNYFPRQAAKTTDADVE
jgi:hypothetical protein